MNLLTKLQFPGSTVVLRSFSCSLLCVFLKFRENISDLFQIFTRDENLKVRFWEIWSETYNEDCNLYGELDCLGIYRRTRLQEWRGLSTYPYAPLRSSLLRDKHPFPFSIDTNQTCHCHTEVSQYRPSLSTKLFPLGNKICLLNYTNKRKLNRQI